MSLKKFRTLAAHQRALVSIGVLLDGHESVLHLENDAVRGEELAEAAESFAELDPELRNVLAGHHLRQALEDMGERIAEGGSIPSTEKDRS
ncbi:hypothetical protein MRY87_10530 [bacterium]|nr:hypothetical protein [bacterium]